MHIVEHPLRPFGPGLVVPAMAEEPDRDDYVAVKGELLLDAQEIILETRAAAQGDYFIIACH